MTWADLHPNDSGETGDGSTATPRLIPARAMLDRASFEIGTGEGHACSVTGIGAYCWGSNFDGQIGDGTTMTPRTVPTAVMMLVNPVRISAGGFFSCAIVSGGAVWCWRAGNEGQLGNGAEPEFVATPVAVASLAAVGQLSVGTSHACALALGRVYCWGRNAEGQLGDGTSGTGRRSSVPIEVTAWPP